MFGNSITNLIGKFKYVPYKIGEPKRLMTALLGVAALATGYGIDETKGKWSSSFKTGALAFGAVCLAAFALGLFNPVTVYGGKKFGTTLGTGMVTGQNDPSWGYSPPGMYYGSEMVVPGICFGPNNMPMPCPSPRDALLPGVGTVGNPTTVYGTTGNSGYTTGQTDPLINGQPPGAYYGTEVRQPARPVFFGGNVIGCNPMTGEGCYDVPPSGGDIFIREVGEVDFNGGI